MQKTSTNITKVPAKAKKRAAQVNMMQRSTDEMGKFDNTSATSISMGITAVIGLGIELCFYLFMLVFRINLKGIGLPVDCLLFFFLIN